MIELNNVEYYNVLGSEFFFLAVSVFVQILVYNQFKNHKHGNNYLKMITIPYDIRNNPDQSTTQFYLVQQYDGNCAKNSYSAYFHSSR